MDRKIEVMGWLEGMSQDDWMKWHSDSEVQNIAKAALELLKEQEDIGAELTNAMELIHKKNERIKKLEEQIETLTRWRANAGAFD